MIPHYFGLSEKLYAGPFLSGRKLHNILVLKTVP